MRSLRSLSIACVAIGAVLLMAAAPFRAPPAELSFGQYAKTYCMKGQTEQGKDTVFARTSLDDTLFWNEGFLEEVRAHEAIHRAWYTHNLNQCGHLTSKLALSLEVDAYCRTADIAVHYGGDSSLVYFRDAALLVGQFRESVAYHDVIAAWYTRCGDLIPLPRKKPPVTRDTTRHG